MACCLLHLMVLFYQQRTGNGTTLMAVCVEFKNYANSDLLSRVYHTRQGKNTPICQSLPFFLRTQRLPQNAPYNKRQDTAVMVIPCLCFLRMALTYIVPVLHRPTEALQTVLRQAVLSW